MFEAKVLENIKEYILGSVIFFSENPSVYDIMWKKMAKPNMTQMTI